MMPRILLVEDNETNRDMLSRRLVRRGYEVLAADNGIAGVEIANSHLPDVILMDISLPGMDGWEATQILKASALTRGIPIIILTAHATIEDRNKAFRVGSDEFETKPVEFSRLLQKIEKLVRT